MAEQQEKRVRKPKARDFGIVMGAIDERLAILGETAQPSPEMVASNVARLRELIDEAKRAINGRSGEEEA